MKKNFFLFIFLLIISFSCGNFSKGGKQSTISNYKKTVDYYAKVHNLPSSYFLALIMLESSGRAVIKPRFEKHIYSKLNDLKNRKIERFEDLTYDDVKNYSTKQLKQLAKSYGPFQIMGYKTIRMNITIDELCGDSSIMYGIEWIDKEYGEVLRRGNYMDAFHLHNTGKPYPQNGKSQTYDPEYVNRGIEFMHYFSKLY